MHVLPDHSVFTTHSLGPLLSVVYVGNCLLVCFCISSLWDTIIFLHVQRLSMLIRRQVHLAALRKVISLSSAVPSRVAGEQTSPVSLVA